ncbi:hypothetical protein [Saccharothrix coeruleofusca]|uniref:Uncharacterized protein n=1 Tax=Saccharothrix coeruleofusca TaxID=33919 RepID=A0A918EBV6_9PSEU|nr:hypothetical protein [Saccharothrix coeruleofusca]MBP2334049.1 hypothetical protein [Saccharothrix coeruleofusca]GGP43764.1 hypothetical protein GCM10010185_14320 [Saccharothrix coeruleofusca]
MFDHNPLTGGRKAVVATVMAIGFLVSTPAAALAWTGIINDVNPDKTSTVIANKR